jgi:carbon starvation protein
MIGESLLGLLAVLACTAGFATKELWHTHYSSFSAAKGLAAKLGGFIEGTTSFLTALGLAPEIASALIAMVVVSFALTTLDSATRLLRFNIEELLGPLKVPFVTNRYVSSLAACVTIAFFATYKVGGKPAALALWQLFGTTNQLLAGLTLTMVTLYLKHRGKPLWFTGIPAVFMMGSTLVSMVINLKGFATGAQPDYLLTVVGGILLALGVWILVEAMIALKGGHSTDDPLVALDE